MEQQIIFSGIQPSGVLHLGNYLGAVKNWVALQEEYKCYCCVVDMHALTVRQNPAELRSRTLDAISMYLAAGVDPKRSTIYVQSHVPAHAELTWILNCFTYMGELSRMTQFKEKSAKNEDNINAGLFTYPVLMASDILLYQADLVPVGADQRQHIEITRDIAIRFNNIYGDVFTVPEGYIPKEGARIMSLQEPTSKMSKSDPNVNGYISILDAADVVRRKIKRAVTDSDGEIRFAEEKPGVSNLLLIYAACTEKSIAETETFFAGKNYGVLKESVAEAIIEKFTPLQAEYTKIRSDKAYLESILKEGAMAAEKTAQKTLRKVYKKVGFTPRIF